MKFETTHIVGVEDIGLNNQMKNFAFLSCIEEIACAHSATCGYGVNDIDTKKRAWLLMDWKLKIYKRPIYNDKILIKTWARDLGRNSYFSYRDFEIYLNDEKIAIATSKWVLFDFNENKITKLNEEIYGPYIPENEHVFENENIDKIIEPKEYQDSITYKVSRRDIDINKHMHNLNYLTLAYEVLPENIYFSEELKNVSIMYKHQILLDEEIKCFYNCENDTHTITIKSSDEKKLHAIIELK